MGPMDPPHGTKAGCKESDKSRRRTSGGARSFDTAARCAAGSEFVIFLICEINSVRFCSTIFTNCARKPNKITNSQQATRNVTGFSEKSFRPKKDGAMLRFPVD